MLTDEEIDTILSSVISLEPDGLANNVVYQNEAALGSTAESDFELTLAASHIIDEGNTVQAIGKMQFEPEEQKTGESGKQNNMEVDNAIGANASGSSWRSVSHEKERISFGNCDSANASQTGNVKVAHEHAYKIKDEEENEMPTVENVKFGSEKENTQGRAMEEGHNIDENVKVADEYASKIIEEENEVPVAENDMFGLEKANIQGSMMENGENIDDNVKVAHDDASKITDVEENEMPVVEHVSFGSEEENIQGRMMEDGENIDQNDADGYKNKEANALGEDDEMDNNDHQKEEIALEEKTQIGSRIGDKSKEETATVENQGTDNILQRGSHTAALPLEVEAGSSSHKGEVLEKVEKTGMIFMCNKRTKQDCFDYKVFGLPANKRDVVRKVSKGMRLFLFDIDLRVMYGIYEAVAPGDLNIEPKAFKSTFPSQVRFTVVKNCSPLPEEKFKRAIKDNYYRKSMFNCQLTSKQVYKLSKLFIAATRIPSVGSENDDIASTSQANTLSSSPIDMDIEQNDGKLRHSNPVEEKSGLQDMLVTNKGKISVQEKNELTETQEDKNNEEFVTVKDKTIERLCLEADGKDEESASEGETGMIFMCSSSTKQDCLLYKVLGLPANKRGIVQKVHKGMKLFMFDVDLRLMYGIYKAAGPGGYNIEPKAFNSSFPSQVRFTVVKDCPPLKEDKFRTAIKDNYYRKNKFSFQLTSDQVKELSKLFVAASIILKHDDVASTSQSKTTLLSPVDMSVEGMYGEVKQADRIEEAINKENAMVKKDEETGIEEKIEETGSGEVKKDEENFLVEDKTKEPMCLEADDDHDECSSEEGEGEENEEEKEEISREDESSREVVVAISERKVRKKRKPTRGSTGMIFMCSSKTKPDCLRYKVLGLPANMKEVVQNIHKGMKLFMFDVDLRLMYGIYKAAGHGGYNIEPKAFNSNFPSQVRFTVAEDCVPLGEEKFKIAIKDNYYTKWKFNPELTSEQVKNLCKIFYSASRGRDRTRQQNNDLPIAYREDFYQQRVVPFAQPPPPTYTQTYGSYVNTNVYRQASRYQPHAQTHGSYGKANGHRHRRRFQPHGKRRGVPGYTPAHRY